MGHSHKVCLLSSAAEGTGGAPHSEGPGATWRTQVGGRRVLLAPRSQQRGTPALPSVPGKSPHLHGAGEGPGRGAGGSQTLRQAARLKSGFKIRPEAGRAGGGSSEVWDGGRSAPQAEY